MDRLQAQLDAAFTAIGANLTLLSLTLVAIVIGIELYRTIHRGAFTAVGRARRRERRAWHRAEPLLDWAARHADELSGVYLITPPCGHGFWSLYAPGSPETDRDFPLADVEPLAQLADDGAAEDPLGWGGEPLTLPEVRAWAVPWVAEVTGGDVAEMVHGWGAPYGPDRNMYEYAIFVRVVARKGADHE
jgi:hypothetical protein